MSLDALGIAKAAAGDRDEALSVVEELLRSGVGKYGGSRIAAIYALLGETDRAFEWLERAIAGRDCRALWMRNLRSFDTLRRDPRYAKLLATMKLD